MLEGMISHKEERMERINIRERLLMWRGATGLTQKELGRRAGIVQTYVSFLEIGRRVPTIRTIERLADAMDITVEQFLFGDPKYPEMPTYDDGYVQALLDVKDFIMYKSEDLMKQIYGKGKDRKIMLGLLTRLLLDEDALRNFKKFRHKAKFRVYDDGTIAEIL